jgi:hypothetical protein
MDPRAGLNTEATGKILSHLQGLEHRSSGRPAPSQAPYTLSYPGSQQTDIASLYPYQSVVSRGSSVCMGPG